jgi:hypothetical protein
MNEQNNGIENKNILIFTNIIGLLSIGILAMTILSLINSMYFRKSVGEDIGVLFDFLNLVIFGFSSLLFFIVFLIFYKEYRLRNKISRYILFSYLYIFSIIIIIYLLPLFLQA